MRHIIKLLKRMDFLMTLAVAALLGIGVAFIFSADQSQPGGAQALFVKQIVWAGLGVICFLAFAVVDYHRWYHRAWWLYALGLILLLLIFVPGIGVRVYGARRWLQIAGVRFVQPAELVKLLLIIVLARLFGAPGTNPRDRLLVAAGLALTMIPMLLIMAQPDLGTSLIFLPILGGVMVVAGVPLRTLLGLASAAGLVLALVFILLLAPPALGWDEERHDNLLQSCGISTYQKNRIMVFLNLDTDPLGTGWNKAQSQIAVGSGGMWGKGFRRGTQNILGFLPRTVAPNDFIFSVIAEERGFAGAITVITLFAVVLLSGLRAALAAPDKVGRLICAGVTTMLFCHVFVNIAMTIGLLPITGLPLPLLSYGGTFMIGVMSALGLVQSVYIRAARSI